MTLSQIMKTALRQLDEPPEDLSEYDELFRGYANAGYRIAVESYLRPREMRVMTADSRGRAVIAGQGVRRVVRLEREDGAQVPFALEESGGAIATRCPGETLLALCEVRYPDLRADDDEPLLPPGAQAALADYICWRYLSCGSPAKQKRAQVFYAQFLQAMQAIEPHGYRSVTRERNLYAATGLR